jgi:Ammonium Transporter Family
VFPVHWLGGAWGYLTVGLFAENPVPLTTTSGKEGLFIGGHWFFLVVQIIAIVALTLLGLIGAYPILWLTNKIIPLRLDQLSEEKGCDIVEHGINDPYLIPPIDTFKLSDVKANNQLSITSLFGGDTSQSYNAFPSNSMSYGVFRQTNDATRHRITVPVNQLFQPDGSDELAKSNVEH